MGTKVSQKEQWWFDRPYFWMALQQVKLYEEAEADLEPHMRPLVQTTYAADSLVMLVAAMEAHANYLLLKQVTTKTGLSLGECLSLVRKKGPVEKWLFVCKKLAGTQLLDKCCAPFKEFCTAVTLRNEFVAHPKLLEVVVTGPNDTVEPSIQSAKAAIEAARGVLKVVYEGMGDTMPEWCQWRREDVPIVAV